MEGENQEESRIFKLLLAHLGEVDHVALGDEVHVHNGPQGTDADVEVDAAAFRFKDGLRRIEDKDTFLWRFVATQTAGDK